MFLQRYDDAPKSCALFVVGTKFPLASILHLELALPEPKYTSASPAGLSPNTNKSPEVLCAI